VGKEKKHGRGVNKGEKREGRGRREFVLW